MNEDTDIYREQPVRDNSLDIKRYLSLFLSNWYWFAGFLFIAISIAYLFNRYSEEIYVVSSTLLIKDEQLGGGPRSESFLPGTDFFRSRQNINNEIGVLKSFTLNRRVIDSLPDFHITYVGIGKRNIAEKRLYNNAPFVVIPDSAVQQPGGRISLRIESDTHFTLQVNEGRTLSDTMRFGERFNKLGYDFVVEVREGAPFIYMPGHSNKYQFWFPNLTSLANQYRSRLSIAPIDKESSLLTLSVAGPVPAQEADYLNMLMELYRERELDVKRETADSTISFIDDQIYSISGSLDTAEKNLMEFRKEHKLVDISREGTLIQARLEQLESEQTKTRLQHQYYKYLQEYLSERGSSYDIIAPSAMGVTDPQLVRLVEELALLQQQKRQMLLNLQHDSAPLELIERSISQIRGSLEEIVSGGMRTIESTLHDIGQRIYTVENSIARLPEIERKYISIQRDFELNNTVHNFLLEKRAEAGIAKAAMVAENRVIDRAYSFNSRQIRPQDRRNYLMAITLGLLFPALSLVLLDYLNNRIIDRKDVERGTTAPILGYISHNKLKSELAVAEKPGSTLAEAFRAVRTSLNYYIPEGKPAVIAVSSTITAEGKTFVSVNLATVLAMLNRRVLVVGLDLRRPRVHRVLDAPNEAGISTWLAGMSEYDDIIRESHIDNLWYAPSGPVPPNPAELIGSEKMREFFERARQHFDYIVVDTPPIAVVTDALLIAAMADVNLLVVRQRYTTKNTLSLVEELYSEGKLQNLGVVINDVNLSGYYGYGIRYGYTMGYNYGYGQYGAYGTKAYGSYYLTGNDD